MKKKKHISAGRVTADDVVSAIRFQDIYPEDFNTRRRTTRWRAGRCRARC